MRIPTWLFLSLSLVPLTSLEAQVPDYVGFYGLNIPGFHWEEGAKVEVEYRRLTGTLDVGSRSHPQFLSQGHGPVELSFDQTSRLLLAVEDGQAFDLVGLEGTAHGSQGESRFFVVFLAVVGERQINLIPALKSSGSPNQGNRSPGPGGPSQGGPSSGSPGSGGPGSAP